MNSNKPKPARTITDDFIEEICGRIAAGKRVRRTLPMGGRIHIDRALPFLVVYRQPHERPDAGTDQLVKGEASYLIASGNPRLSPSLRKLVRKVVKTLFERCEAVLIIEIFSGAETVNVNDDALTAVKPKFRVITSSKRPPTKAVDALQKSLKRIKILKRATAVEVSNDRDPLPPGLPTLIPATEARKHNCFQIAIEVAPIYRGQAADQIYPLVLRNLHTGFTRALRQTQFEFARTNSSQNPLSCHALGRRAVVKSVWAVDKQLANISNSFDFLLQVSPINTDSEWSKFQHFHFNKTPNFYYRPLPVDPPLLKRELYKIPIENVEDPTLAYIFREKQLELDRKLTMLWDRGSNEFLAGSMQLYGRNDKKLTDLAKSILMKLPKRSRDESQKSSLNAEQFARRAEKELDYYRQIAPDITSKVAIRSDTVGLMVSHGNLLIGKQTMIPASRVDALLQHEVGTHVVTYFNGCAQPFQLLHCGLSGYDELQEGIAVLAEYMVGGLNRPRLRLLAGRVIAANCLISGATFIETFRELNRIYGFNQRTAYVMTVRIFRGGGLNKDAVYLHGLVGLLNYLKGGGSIEPLFVGKIASYHVPVILELQHRGVIKPPRLRPRYMNIPGIEEKLTQLKKGLTPFDLIRKESK